ncbi:MAG TPA: histidine kinase dimerization/phospho-acceptor domain-containing protein, partial [Pyrinomonadaceae bacterium]|nr:histidine kinase dimerization/phospho-acceptor domain-containing protein [Pyrinomonadaceae bacterium]
MQQPAPDKHTEVVYRRTPDPTSASTAAGSPDQGAGYAPALAPLIIGFLLLLALILVLGLRTANKMGDVGMNARILTGQYSSYLSRLADLRLSIIRLDSEARIRATAEAGRQLTPPLEMRLDKARGDVKKSLANLGIPPFHMEKEWEELKADTQAYIDVTGNLKQYSLDGFDRFRKVDSQLNEVYKVLLERYETVDQEMAAYQRAASRSNIVWIAIVVLVGALVAVGTMWQVQRHFSQMRRSVLETRRERTFATQLLEGMVSAIAAIDEEDRIRSANAAFFRIFPSASIGASVLEKLAPEDAMKMLEAVTAIRVMKATYHGRWIAQVEGDDKAFDVYSSPLAINGDRGQIVTLVDATEAAESERTLRRSESLAAVGQATAQVAHEIRNPLGSIRLGVSMLRDSVNDSEALNTIELVERGIKHLNKLVV